MSTSIDNAVNELEGRVKALQYALAPFAEAGTDWQDRDMHLYYLHGPDDYRIIYSAHAAHCLGIRS